MRPRAIYLVLLALFLCVGELGIAGKQNPIGIGGVGTVEGRVIDWSTGDPVPNARVVVEPDEVESGGGSKVRSAATNGVGAFSFEVSPGAYVIAASKPQDYYPDTDAAAFASHLEALPKISIREGQTISNIVARIEKGARLIGTIYDKRTGQPIVESRIRLSRVDNPKLWIETGPDIHGYFELVIPARPFKMEVSASGYKKWIFQGQSFTGLGGVLQVKPKTIFELPVALER